LRERTHLVIAPAPSVAIIFFSSSFKFLLCTHYVPIPKHYMGTYTEISKVVAKSVLTHNIGGLQLLIGLRRRRFLLRILLSGACTSVGAAAGVCSGGGVVCDDDRTFRSFSASVPNPEGVSLSLTLTTHPHRPTQPAVTHTRGEIIIHLLFLFCINTNVHTHTHKSLPVNRGTAQF